MRLRDFLTLRTNSINPQASPDMLYRLYSLPSFDNGRQIEEIPGREIQSNKFAVPNKCILFNKLNVQFKRIWRIDNEDDNKIASTEFLPLVVDETIADYQYVFYLLNSPHITNYLTGQHTNTSHSHKRIDPENFLNIEVTLPPISSQRKIGGILAVLDAKIDLNRSINHYLAA